MRRGVEVFWVFVLPKRPSSPTAASAMAGVPGVKRVERAAGEIRGLSGCSSTDQSLSRWSGKRGERIECGCTVRSEVVGDLQGGFVDRGWWMGRGERKFGVLCTDITSFGTGFQQQRWPGRIEGVQDWDEARDEYVLSVRENKCQLADGIRRAASAQRRPRCTPCDAEARSGIMQ